MTVDTATEMAASDDVAARRRAMRAAAYALLSVLCFAAVPICVRYLSAWLGPAEIVVLRNAVGFTLLLPWASRAVWRGGWRALSPGPLRFHLMRSGANSIGMILWFWAIANMMIADAMALQFTLPLWTAIFAILFLGERVGPRRATALVVGFAGVLVIIRPGFAEVGLPALSALTSAALYAGCVVVIRRQTQSVHPVIIMFYTTLLMGLFALGPALFDWRGLPWQGVPWIVALGTIGFVAQFSLAHALKLAETKVIMPFDFLRMPLAAGAAFILFGQSSDLWTWVGAAVIFAATYYIAQRDAKTAMRRSPKKTTEARGS